MKLSKTPSNCWKQLCGGVLFFDAEDRELAERFTWFTWRPSGSNRLVYAVRKIRLPSGGWSKRLFHREVLGLLPSDPDVDHWDTNGLNNRRENLRLVSNSQNQANARKHMDAVTSRFKGVVQSKGAFQAQIQFQKTRHYLGRFPTEEEAALAYNRAARKFFGPFALLNKI